MIIGIESDRELRAQVGNAVVPIWLDSDLVLSADRTQGVGTWRELTLGGTPITADSEIPVVEIDGAWRLDIERENFVVRRGSLRSGIVRLTARESARRRSRLADAANDARLAGWNRDPDGFVDDVFWGDPRAIALLAAHVPCEDDPCQIGQEAIRLIAVLGT